METANSKLWLLLDKMRGQGYQFNALDILQEAKAQNIEVGFNDLRSLILREGKTGAFVIPEHITDFIIAFFKNNGLNSILDCWADMGALLSPLAQKYKPALAIGLNKSNAAHEIAKLMQRGHQIDLRLGEPMELLTHIDVQFDGIVCCPPFGWKPQSYSFQLDDQEIELHDDYANLLLLKASLLLKESGSALFVLPPSFIFRRGKRKVIDNLTRFDLYIDAVFHLESGTFAPTTKISGLLVVIRRETGPSLFVGEITADESQRNILLRNFRIRKEGKSPQLGALVKIESFRSFSTLVTTYEAYNLAHTLGVPPTNLIDICTSINLPKRNFDIGFEDLQNAVYLPIIGNSPAVASLAELKIKAQNYVQIIVNPDKAIAEYLAHFFNTPLGYKIRESLTSGFIIPKITKNGLSAATVYLPDIPEQTEIISTQTAITYTLTRLETLSNTLWRHPRKYKNIQKLVKSMQPNNDLEDWIETLPFPISSILWAYHADAAIERKVEHLLLFFEALAEFIATVMLSAYASNKNFYTQESGAWVDTDPKYKDWVLTSTFGGWRILGERLAKVTRRLQTDKETRDICMRLFGNPSMDFLGMITDKSLFAVLRDVNNYRDQWKGHSGALGDRAHKRHLLLLESKLSEVRKVMKDKWEDILLLSPMKNEYSEGIFEYQVKAIMGTRTPFQQVTVKTLVPMDKSNIYILHPQQQRPLELLPFIRLMESPKTQANAMYFYNRIINGKVRWVSYHFDEESEIIRRDSAVDSAIMLLIPGSTETH